MPIFSFRMALFTWICGLLVAMICLALSELLPKLGSVFVILLVSGQVPLAAFVTRGRMRITAHLGLSWIDILTTFLVPWLGPLFWYYEWRRIQKNPSIADANIAEWNFKKRRVFLFLLFTSFLSAILIWIRWYLNG